MKSFRECLDSVFWIFPVFYFILDPVLYLLLLLGIAVFLIYVSLMVPFCILLDALIGYETLGEYSSDEKNYAYQVAEFTVMTGWARRLCDGNMETERRRQHENRSALTAAKAP